MKIFKLCLYGLLVSPILFSCQNDNTSSFVFNSNYCQLNNERHYQENKEKPITLTLTLQEKYQATHDVPEDVYVLIGEEEGHMGEDYEYQISDDRKSATISLCVVDDITITANLGGDDELYKINEENYNQAITMTDPDIQYAQRSYQRGTISGGQLGYLAYWEEYVSPNMYHSFFREVQTTGGSTAPKEYYVKKENDKYTKYEKDAGEWKPHEAQAEDFVTPKNFSIKSELDARGITYQGKVKDSYDAERRGYFFDGTYGGHPYIYALSFYMNRLIFYGFEYYDEGYGMTIYGTMNLTYGTITPVVPTSK